MTARGLWAASAGIDLAAAPAGLARWPAGALVAGLHGLAVWALWSGLPPAASLPQPLPMQVRMLQAAPVAAPTPAPVQPAKPLPQTARPLRLPRPTPTPLLAAAHAAPSSSPIQAAPAAPAPVAASPAAAEPAPVSAARFDADYLHNPAPAYPAMSRRNGEEGRVQLSVRVSAQGRAEQVEVRHSSGHPRLDDVAASTVRQWRFVPARRGDEPISATVLVPIVFRLDAAS